MDSGLCHCYNRAVAVEDGRNHDRRGAEMIIVTTHTIPGMEIERVVGLVRGSVVQSKNIGKDFMAGFKSMVGGEIKDYTEMMDQAREISISRRVQQAQALGADAIVGLLISTSSIMQGCSEVMAYGTAVKLKG